MCRKETPHHQDERRTATENLVDRLPSTGVDERPPFHTPNVTQQGKLNAVGYSMQTAPEGFDRVTNVQNSLSG